MISFIVYYYLIGVGVSLYFIWWYRSTDRTAPKKTDGLGGLIGPWVWPLQVILHIYQLTKKK